MSTPSTRLATLTLVLLTLPTGCGSEASDEDGPLVVDPSGDDTNTDDKPHDAGGFDGPEPVGEDADEDRPNRPDAGRDTDPSPDTGPKDTADPGSDAADSESSSAEDVGRAPDASRCDAGGSYCGGACVDTTSNAEHCGDCGNSCGVGRVCESGRCETDPQLEGVISETNAARSTETDCGSEGTHSAAPPLTGAPELHRAAQGHAEDMATNDFLGHEGSDGSDFVARIHRTDFSGAPVAENVAAGNDSGSTTVDQWLGSDGHCRNIMLRRATHIGVGVAYSASSQYGWYWVQLFGQK